MTENERVLALLENHRGIYLSGESIAEQLMVSRAAVAKAIQSLRDDGYDIDARSNRGYSLLADSDRLSESGILKHLKHGIDLKIEFHQRVSSTNALLRDRIHEGEGLVLVANEQTAGSGRLGRKFYSPQGTGIYFSLLLKPEFADTKATLLTSVAAVAVCRAIESVSDKKPRIKWVNDIYLDGKKVCGILTQASFSLEHIRADYVIVGIGINVYRPRDGFPEELEQIANAVFDKPQGDLKNRLLAEVLNHFWDLYHHFDRQAIADEYKSYSFVIGKDVWIISPTQTIAATVLDIDHNCNLVVCYEDGRIETLSSNEISIRTNN